MPFSHRPAYQLHRASGQAKVRLGGKDHYLGKYGTPASKERYRTLLAEWATSQSSQKILLSIGELARAYLDFAATYYVKAGEPTSEVGAIRTALRVLVQQAGSILATEIGPKRLITVRDVMVEIGWARPTINAAVNRIRRMFRWAAEQELIPGRVVADLDAVRGLRQGRTAAREPEPVLPVEDTVVDATLPFMSPIVADMVRIQRFTGMRPAEVCGLRPRDIDQSSSPWLYRVREHKTIHFQKERHVYIGPRAQEILRPYLLRDSDRPCFSPAEADRLRRSKLHECRQTPLATGNRPGTNRKAVPRRSPGEHYTPTSYARAITRACEAAFSMPKQLRSISKKVTADQIAVFKSEAMHWRRQFCWSPNQLRHKAATDIRQRFGLEAAQVALGHSRADVTEIYASRDRGLAASVAEAMG